MFIFILLGSLVFFIVALIVGAMVYNYLLEINEKKSLLRKSPESPPASSSSSTPTWTYSKTTTSFIPTLPFDPLTFAIEAQKKSEEVCKMNTTQNDLKAKHTWQWHETTVNSHIPPMPAPDTKATVIASSGSMYRGPTTKATEVKFPPKTVSEKKQEKKRAYNKKKKASKVAPAKTTRPYNKKAK